MQGTIRLLKNNAWGFIRGEDGNDYFFHRTGLEMTTCAFEELRQEDRMTFTPIDGPTNRGPRAIEVRRND